MKRASRRAAALASVLTAPALVAARPAQAARVPLAPAHVAAAAHATAAAHPAAGPDSLPSPEAVRAYVDTLARAALAAGPGAGLSIGVVRGRDTLVWRGWGKANVELGVPAGPRTVYEIGSITKQFTAALILREAQAGRLSLDDPITKYVPGYDTHGHTVTLRELLGHTGGVPNYTNSKKLLMEGRLDLSHQQVLAMGEKDSLDFTPGTRWSYSNTGFYLLGMVLEKVTGRPYDELVDDSLVAPLGLEHTSYCWRQPLIPGRAEGYAIADSVRGLGKLDHPVLVNARPVSMAVPYAAGSMCSTIGDLVRWTSLLHEGKVVSPASYRLMSTADTLPDGLSTHYGFGLDVDRLGTHRVVWHNGGIFGFLTSLARYPDDSLTVVVLSNATSVDPTALQAGIAGFALGVPAPREQPSPLPDGLAGRITGTYRLVDGHIVRISLEGDTLVAETEGRAGPRRMPLVYFGSDPGGAAVLGFGPGIGPRLVFHLPRAAGAPARRMTFEPNDSGISKREGMRVANGGS